MAAHEALREDVMTLVQFRQTEDYGRKNESERIQDN